MRGSWLILLCCVVSTGPAVAQTTWQVASGPSSVTFKVQHLLFSQIEGAFKNYRGHVITPNADFSDALIEAVIPVNSIYTGHRARDSDLLGEDFFDAAHYPEIRFKSNAFEKTGEHTYKIIGALTIRGVTRTIELLARCTDPRSISGGRTRVDFTAHGSINRYDYGLRWNEIVGADQLLMGKTVEITLNIALIKES